MPENSSNQTINVDIIYLFCALGCVICAALAAGMTTGLLSIDSLKLQIKLEVGTEAEKLAAKRILPIISNHHLLLCTLLLFNALANEALPIFLDEVVPSWAAIIISVTLVLIFGEIIPTALFTGPDQLAIASRFSKLVLFLEFIFYPIAFPMAKLLDNILGHIDDDNLSRDEISALVRIIRNQQSGLNTLDSHDPTMGQIDRDSELRKSLSINILKNENLTTNEVDVITGVLGLSKIPVRDICTPIDKVTMLSNDQILDKETIDVIDKVGFSRLPVFRGVDRTNIIGYLLVKRLININPEAGVPLSTIELSRPIVIGAEQSLLEVLNLFKSGHRHMGIVTERPVDLIRCINNKISPERAAAPIGILTVEDVFERMIQAEINDEEDNDKESVHESASVTLRELSMRSSFAPSLTSYNEKPTVQPISTNKYPSKSNARLSNNSRGSTSGHGSTQGLSSLLTALLPNQHHDDSNNSSDIENNNRKNSGATETKKKVFQPTLVTKYSRSKTYNGL